MADDDFYKSFGKSKEEIEKVNLDDWDENGVNKKEEEKRQAKEESIKSVEASKLDREIADKLRVIKIMLHARSFEKAAAMIDDVEKMEEQRAESSGYCDNPEVYWCKVLLKNRARDEADLISKKPELENDDDFSLAVDFCKTEEQKQRYLSVAEKIKLSETDVDEPEEPRAKPAKKAETGVDEAIQKRLRRISHMIDAGDFDEARERLEKLEQEEEDRTGDCEIPQIYHYKMLLDYKARTDEELIAALIEKQEDITQNKNYRYAKNYAEDVEDDAEFDALLAIKKKSTDGIAKAKAEEERLRKIADLTSQADEAYKNKNYDNAIDLYNQAIQLGAGDLQSKVEQVKREKVTEIEMANLIRAVERREEQAKAAYKRNKKEDFYIEDGVLVEYKGNGGDVVIPDSVTSIGDEAFFCCHSLTNITIPDSVSSIGEFAFTSCSSLTNITIPDSVSSIGDEAFFYCTSLTNITIPDSVTSIGESAFASCASLTNITIPDSVTIIGDGAFFNCTSLESINVNDGNVAYKSIDGNLYSRDGKTLIQYAIGKTASLFIIPDRVTTIGKYAFRHCSSLTSITIPNNVTTIGNSAFSGCSSLTSITIPDSVTTVGDSAFGGCTSLTSITIGNGVATIGKYVFVSCDSLKYIYCRASTKPQGLDKEWLWGNKAQVIWNYKG